MREPTEQPTPPDSPTPDDATDLDEPSTLEVCRREYAAGAAARDSLDRHVRRYLV